MTGTTIRPVLVLALVTASVVTVFAGSAVAVDGDATVERTEDCLDGCLDGPDGDDGVGVMPGDNVQSPVETPAGVETPNGGLANKQIVFVTNPDNMIPLPERSEGVAAKQIVFVTDSDSVTPGLGDLP